MTAHRIRRLEATDLESLSSLHRLCFPHDPWSRQALAEVLAMPGADGWLALDQTDAACGFLLVRRAADEAEILTLGVAPARRGRSLGGALLEAGLAVLAGESVARLYLEVAVDNSTARRLYRRFGFVEVGRRPGYLSGPDGPVDALVLACRLDG